MNDQDAEHTLTEQEIIDKLVVKVRRLRELLRWRDSMQELPANPDRYLVTHGCADSELDFEFARYDATLKRWSNGDARYWRPIGPLPRGEQ